MSMQNSTDTNRLSLAGEGVNDTHYRFSIATLRLGSLVERHEIDEIAFLKIDVEGFEIVMLQNGASALLKRKNIILEIFPETNTAVINLTLVLFDEASFASSQVDRSDFVVGELPVENNLWAKRMPYGVLLSFLTTRQY